MFGKCRRDVLVALFKTGETRRGRRVCVGISGLAHVALPVIGKSVFSASNLWTRAIAREAFVFQKQRPERAWQKNGKQFPVIIRQILYERCLDMNELKPIEPLILTLRGQRVILDADLAEIYGVPTKVLN